MSGKGMGGETVKRLAPSSWPGVAVWAVILVVFVSHPWEASKATASTVWGTGRWLGYTAFADCGDVPPFGWMEPKACADTLPDADVVEGQADGPPVADAAVEGHADHGSVYGTPLPSPERVQVWVTGIKDRTAVLVLDEGGEPR